jgi:hypothetical protein
MSSCNIARGSESRRSEWDRTRFGRLQQRTRFLTVQTSQKSRCGLGIRAFRQQGFTTSGRCDLRTHQRLRLDIDPLNYNRLPRLLRANKSSYWENFMAGRANGLHEMPHEAEEPHSFGRPCRPACQGSGETFEPTPNPSEYRDARSAGQAPQFAPE